MKNFFLTVALFCYVATMNAQESASELAQLKKNAVAEARALNTELQAVKKAYSEAQNVTKVAPTEIAKQSALETEKTLKQKKEALAQELDHKKSNVKALEKKYKQQRREEKRLEKEQKKHEKEKKQAEKKQKRIEKAQKRLEKAKKRLVKYEKDFNKKSNRFESRKAKMNAVAELKAKKNVLKAQTKVEAQKMEIQKLEVALRVAHK